MDILLHPANDYPTNQHLTISGSKSESNRLLILQSFFPDIEINNLSTSDDTKYLKKALSHKRGTIDIGHAGTAMRFLTAYYSVKKDSVVVLTGSDRMKQRPIGILVDALRSIGARIEYLEHQGYPPLKIYGGHIKGKRVVVDASVSSQYITALMLIAPSLENGLVIDLTGELTSMPYIKMTISYLKSIGVPVSRQGEVDLMISNDSKSPIKERITIQPLKNLRIQNISIESDWSSIGYWYSWVALQKVGYKIKLSTYYEDSIQGDSRLKDYYKAFGVHAVFENNSIILSKASDKIESCIDIDLINEPDQAQTIFATCLALGVDANLTGLHTLRIKETDRIEALKVVGSRFRESIITTTKDTISVSCRPLKPYEDPVIIDTYNDHRMAMAFAPLSCKTPLIIKDASVVTKSYPEFWEDIKKVNVDITEI